MRAKRTEWRMRGIEPYNKIIVVFPSSVLPSRRFVNSPSPEGEGLIVCVHSCHLGALVEKSHTIDTARFVHAPASSPAVAHRREITRDRNEDERTRITDQANTLNALSLRGAQRRGNLPEGKTYLRTRTKYSPAVAHRREILCERNDDTRTRITDQANDLNALSLRGAQRRGNLPEGKTYLRTRTKYPPAVAHRREILCGRNGTIDTCACPLARTVVVPRSDPSPPNAE